MLGQKLLMRMGRAIKGIFIGSDNLPPVITTSTSATATAYSNQRKLDRTSNGVLWAMFWSAADTQWKFYYSIDEGVTWTLGATQANSPVSYTPNASFFIDQDDYAHFVYKAVSDGFIYYRRGTPNAARTSWTWSNANTVEASTVYDYPDIVAHREGTGWKIHIVYARANDTTFDRVWYRPVTISSNGTITVEASTALSGAYGNFVHKYPSIDFNHTGDGKTVAGGTPHLYVAWSAGATGAGKGIRFKKATYNAGVWTWGTEREIDSTRYVSNENFWLNCMFDGTRVVMPGFLSGNTTVILERDAADSTTVVRFTNTSLDSPGASGSGSYDSDGNVYIIARDSTVPRHVQYLRWVRATGTSDAPVVIDSNADLSNPYVSVKRGYSGDRIEFIYTDGTASPYSIKYSYVGGPVELYPVQITTSTAATATAYSNQRKVDRTSNGVLWTININDGIRLHARYSLDEGITWSAPDSLGPGGAATYVMNASLFIDQDDYAHVVYKNPNDGFIYYRRGTPNAARTSWTWSVATVLFNANASADYPDVIAHREGTGWAVHVVYSRNIDNAACVEFYRLNVSSSGVISIVAGGSLATAYGNTVHKYPSIDFNHTGDGKTVKDGTPHLYVAWSAGATGAGKGIRFKKATYSGGSWTWGTEREIDQTRYVLGGESWLNCLFDGTRVIIGGALTDGPNYDVVLHERDAADTATTTRELLSNIGTSPYDNGLYFGSLSYDSSGNVYLIGVSYRSSDSTYEYVCRKWTRSEAILGSEVRISQRSSVNYIGHVSVKRGYSNNKIEFVYTDGAASPYPIKYGAIV